MASILFGIFPIITLFRKRRKSIHAPLPSSNPKLRQVASVLPVRWEKQGGQIMSIEATISARFKCAKCSGTTCHTKEVAMTGTGLSKLFDIQHNHFLFVSCANCGYVEVYNPDVLSGKKAGELGTILDILFG
jgi:predicted nucleic-acid-binding Zn-ribbon protein